MPKFSYHMETDFDAQEWTTVTFRKGVKAANLEIARVWLDQFLFKHFTNLGAKEYGYDRRASKYSKRKSRETGERKPLVLSGDTRRMTQDEGAAKGFPTRAVVTMPVPDHFLTKMRDGPDMADELVRISEQEVNILADEWEDAITEFMDNSPKRRRRIKG